MEFIHKAFSPDIYRAWHKKEPRIRSIENIHDLWIKTGNRIDEVRSEYNACIKKITQEVEPNSNKEYLVYFSQSEHIRSYKIRYEESWGCYGSSIGDVRRMDREERLCFILTSANQFELGSEFREINSRLDKCYKHHSIVFRALWQVIERYLRKKLDNCKKIPKILNIKIGENLYYISVENRGQHYHKFEFLGEVNNDVIELGNDVMETIKFDNRYHK